MAMATAAASTTCVATLSASFSATASSTTECKSRVAPSVCTRASSSVPCCCSVKSSAGCRESRAVAGIGGSSSGMSSNIGNGGGARREWRWRAVAEQLQTETEESSEEGFSTDTISIFFEAEGSLPEASVAKLTTTLEGVEGVSNVGITASTDGTATVKLTKQMNVQATGVASGLVEVLIKGGFKLQALNLGLDEDDGDDDDFYEYDMSSSTEEVEPSE